MAESWENPWPGIETAGSLPLSFINTKDWRLRRRPVELLLSYEDLLRWARSAGALTPVDAEALRAQGEARPADAGRVLRLAILTREAMAAIFLSLCRARTVPVATVRRLDRVCRAARAAQRLQPTGSALVWSWRSASPELERPLWAAGLSATELLTSGDLTRVRLCADDECGWLFIDTSRNRSRRWCAMEACGNRNKARRFYRRSSKRVSGE